MSFFNWIPASSGMTNQGFPHHVIPAKAGIQVFFNMPITRLHQGAVRFYIHPSINRQYYYMFCRNKYDIVWLDLVEAVIATVTRWGGSYSAS